MRLYRVVQGFIQSGPENLQGWKVHNLPEQPVLLLDCPHYNIYLFIHSETDFISVLPIPPCSCTLAFCLSTTYHCEKPGFTFLITSLLVWEGHC